MLIENELELQLEFQQNMCLCLLALYEITFKAPTKMVELLLFYDFQAMVYLCRFLRLK